MTRWELGAIIGLLAGCALLPSGRSAALLERADHLVTERNYPAAVRAYDEFLAKHPDDRDAARARSSRDAVADILSAREELATARQDVVTTREEGARLRAELEGRDGEVGRLRQEIARLMAESERLRAETDRLRTDLEKLKRLDLELERRRR